MRTLILVCVVALLAACGVAYAVGLVGVTTDHADGKCVVSLIVNTAMLRHNPSGADFATDYYAPDDGFQDVKGKVTAVRPDKNEVVVSETFKNWTFQLAKDGQVYLNDRESKLGELQAGDDATVTFDRQSEVLIARIVRCNRK